MIQEKKEVTLALSAMSFLCRWMARSEKVTMV